MYDWITEMRNKKTRSLFRVKKAKPFFFRPLRKNTQFFISLPQQQRQSSQSFLGGSYNLQVLSAHCHWLEFVNLNEESVAIVSKTELFPFEKCLSRPFLFLNTATSHQL